MDKIVNPEMLIVARESRGLSQSELAERIKVTQGKISKYENGMLTVDDGDLAAIARELGYTAELFYQKDKVYGLGSSFLFHRQRKSAPVLIQRKIQAEINILRMQIDRLLRSVDMDAEARFEPLDIDAHNGNVEKIAQLVRAAWRIPLGPVASVTAVIENAGGVVLRCDFETPLIDAAHLWLPGLPPLFFINRELPGDRERWTLAHEIGHAIMHRNPTGDVESEANRFAAEFLLPRSEVERHLVGITLQKAAALKPIWKVSMAALIKRAADIGAIPPSSYRRLFTSLSAQGYRTNEPFPIANEEQSIARALVDFHRTQLGYDDFDLAKLLFSPDPQFFAHGYAPSVLKMNNEPFFAFLNKPPGGRPPGTLRVV